MRPGATLLTVLLGALLLSACGQEEEAPASEAEDSALPVGLPVGETPGDGDGDGDMGNPGDGDGDVGNPGDGDGDVGNPGDGDGDGDVTPEPDPEPNNDVCAVWQDCGPLYADPNSGMECVSGTCQCDPAGQWTQTCVSMGGYWVASACQCVFSDVPPPNYEPADNCYWTLEQPPCDPDQWVDTSHYEDECYYNAYDEYVCDAVWVESGYYEAGACPAPYWLELC